ncbi:G1/S-specific cyclin CCN1 [Lachnellula arida]|uniref:G1/S-specific cyclin CCN1 n=1 Tax=Lachnellula arida TaxID=1316785 RepID=A0A8T9BCF0_9HELO|nr:G1/S-specific cyclin CCN1 [Lachnellula arida]
MAYQKQPCDTYFVETHDSSHHQRAPQDYLRMLGRRKQEAMANELSRQACDTYVEDIMNHMKQMEEETLPDVASIDIQQEIQWFMRPYLIDFLIEAHQAFQLLPETLFLAVNLLDRYCSRRVVYKRHYQLVGCAALLIAAKYGDKKDRVPMIRELKSMCCSLYDEDMFTQMEWHVLNTLEWVIGHPTIDTWLQLALKDGPAYEDVEVEHMALYLAEIALYHKDFVSKKSSVMARASLALARGILGRPENLESHDHEVNQTLIELSVKLDRPSQVLFRKYASPHMSRVANRLENFLREQEELNRRANPPTPPAEITIQKATPEMFPGTPQKPYGNGNGNMVNGYMTPPITPEGEYFTGGNGNEMKGYHQIPRCPVTPTPQIHNPYTHPQQYQQYGMGVH